MFRAFFVAVISVKDFFQDQLKSKQISVTFIGMQVASIGSNNGQWSEVPLPLENFIVI